MNLKIGQKLTSQEAMNLSIEEAKKGRAWVSPNPPVGCVILDKNKCFLSTGYHTSYGKAHAEIEALKKIKDKKKLKGAYVYVTLEPCAHHGKTSPCVDALIKYPLDTVYYGQQDCNLKTKGLGLKKLKSKGIKTKKYTLFLQDIEDLYKEFCYNHAYQKTFVSLKVATSLDGKMGLVDGSSQWISSQASRDYVSHLRAYHDAVLIGLRTFLEDNPRLNSRKAPFNTRKNKVILLDPKGRSFSLLKSSQLAQVRPLSNIIVVTSPKTKISSKEIQSITCPIKSFTRQFDLQELKSILYLKYGISSLLVEGGAFTFSSFLEQKAAGCLYQFLSPCILGKNGISWSQELKIKNLKQKQVLQLRHSTSKDADLLLKYLF